MKTRTIIFSTLVLLLLGLSINNAQQGRNFGEGKCRLADELNLTEEQKESINNYRYEHQESMIDLRSKIEQNRLEMDKLMDEDELDQSRILELSRTGSELKGQIQESRTRMWLNIYNTLDENQRGIWKERREGLGKFGHRMKGMGRHGGFNGKGYGRMGQNRGFREGGMSPNSRRR